MEDDRLAAELANLKAQMPALMGAAKEQGVELSAATIYVVFNPNQRPTWCHKTDCPALGRKITYDVVKDDGLDKVIQTGLSEDDAQGDDVEMKVKRVGSPTVKRHDLGILGAFTKKQKALDFMSDYFKLNQDQSPEDLQMCEVTVTS